MNELVFVYKLSSGLFALDVHKIYANTESLTYKDSHVEVRMFGFDILCLLGGTGKK